MVMKNVMAVNVQPNAKCGSDYLLKLIEVQIINSLALGWSAEDIIVVSNQEFSICGIRPISLELNQSCLRGSKLFALAELYRAKLLSPDEVYWIHDLDAWQNHWFDAPEFRDIGLAEYSRPKFNGGSVFYRMAAADIINDAVQDLEQSGAMREEPTLNRLLRTERYRDRVTTLDHTFNVGCSGFVERYQRSQKPVLVSHLHPRNRIAWDTHVNDRNDLGVSSMAPRLVSLLVKHFHGGIAPAKLRPSTS